MKYGQITKILSMLVVWAMPLTVYAGFGAEETAGNAGLLNYEGSIPVLLGNILGAVLSLVGIVFFILVVYGGIMWMTAAGNQDLVKKAINTIISSAIGLVVVLAAYAITNFALSSLGVGS